METIFASVLKVHFTSYHVCLLSGGDSGYGNQKMKTWTCHVFFLVFWNVSTLIIKLFSVFRNFIFQAWVTDGQNVNITIC